ncbi:thiamine pyrophosphate-dependent enzyme [Kocuria rhizophila]|nr:thiamine pyrophosphate-dependent enzyme [Kocuria rhizophila]
MGFTTAPSPPGRTSTYSTDVAGAVQAPIFHVNADDPEAVVRVGAARVRVPPALPPRRRGEPRLLRRRGPTTSDDPSMTQPLMYSLIDGKRSTRKVYTQNLVGRGTSPRKRQTGTKGLPGAPGARVRGDPRGPDSAGPAGHRGRRCHRGIRAPVRAAGGLGRLRAKDHRDLPGDRAGASATPRWKCRGLPPCTAGLKKLAGEARDMTARRDRLGHGQLMAFGSLPHGRCARADVRAGRAPRHVHHARRCSRRQTVQSGRR